MADIRAYWDRVNEQLGALPPGNVLFVTSLDNPERAGGVIAGRVSEVARKQAAELLVMKTHRLSTDAEIAEFHCDAKVRAEGIAKAEYDRKQTMNLKQTIELPEDMKELLMAMRQGQRGRRGKAEDATEDQS